MDRLFAEENIRRYRKLRDRGTAEAQRVAILKQLAEEFAHLRTWASGRAPPPARQARS
jgi:hypothetical protein